MVLRSDLPKMSIAELRSLAKKLLINDPSIFTRQQLIVEIRLRLTPELH
jgi:hypothetical protein